MAQQWDLGIPWDLENTPGILPPFQPLRSPAASQEPCVGDTYIPCARAFFPPPLLILTPGKQDWTSLVPSDHLSGSLADRGCNFTLPRAILIISPCCWRWRSLSGAWSPGSWPAQGTHPVGVGCINPGQSVWDLTLELCQMIPFLAKLKSVLRLSSLSCYKWQKLNTLEVNKPQEEGRKND